MMLEENKSEDNPKVIITEQPRPRGLRFRYRCENRGFTPGSILGMNSTEAQRSYPTVEIVGFQGRAKVVVFCVTIDTPPKYHPHKLIGHQCDAGVMVAYVGPETSMRFSLTNVGIQCVRKRDIGAALAKRYKEHPNQFIAPNDDLSPVNLNALRLCFQVFLETEPNQFTNALQPAISSEIYDKKANPGLKIIDLSDFSAPVQGGKKIILLCEKVDKNNIKVRFFQERPLGIPWEADGSFQPHDVYKQVAIVFTTPSYDDQHITHPVTVKIQLQQPRDKLVSEPLDFQLIPRAPELSLPPFDEILNSPHCLTQL